MKHFLQLLLLSLCFLVSCKESEMEKVYNSFMQNNLVLPSDLLTIVNGVVSEQQVIVDKPTLIVYHDSLSCNMCEISHLNDIMSLVKLSDSLKSFRVMTIFAPNKGERDKVVYNLYSQEYPFPVYVDYNSSLAGANPFIPANKKFHTFLINQYGTPLFVGNPIVSERLRKLFIKTLERYKKDNLEKYQVIGVSMEPTLMDGDYVVVNKNTVSKLSVGDIVVFDDSFHKTNNGVSNNYVKRCMALSGDTISIINGRYRNSNNPDLNVGIATNQDEFIFFQIGSGITQGRTNETSYKPSGSGWTTLDFGPLYIPKQGDVVIIDTTHIELYKRAIEFETGICPYIINDQVYLDDEPLIEYQFQKDWCFLGGDNILNSKDSRCYGIVPQECIIGIATSLIKGE